VEVTDSAFENPSGEANAQHGELVAPADSERLFGLTLTVDDENLTERSSHMPHAE
jgi:hypothetical protein